jgi:hypothetical protein
MKFDRQIVVAIVLGTALHFLLPATTDWFARLSEKWIAAEFVLRLLKK